MSKKQTIIADMQNKIAELQNKLFVSEASQLHNRTETLKHQNIKPSKGF